MFTLWLIWLCMAYVEVWAADSNGDIISYNIKRVYTLENEIQNVTFDLMDGIKQVKLELHKEIEKKFRKTCWNIKSPGCVNGHNIVTYHKKTLDECKELCSTTFNCLSFEYGVAHGGSGKYYKPGDCHLNNGADSSGCDGKVVNMDLYVKIDCEEGRRKWKLQASNVCFAAKGNKPGVFKLKNEGSVIALKLVHQSGFVSCIGGEVKPTGKSNSGCSKDDSLLTLVTDKVNRRIFPKWGWNSEQKLIAFFIPGYNSKSDVLVYTDHATPMYGVIGQELRIWYGEDLYDLNESDNSGVSCVDVYVIFA